MQAEAIIILLPYVQDIGSWDQILHEEIPILVEPSPHFRYGGVFCCRT